MKRLYVLVEGQTEEAFVKRVLQPHFALQSLIVVPIIVTTRRDLRTGRKSKGGGHWAHWSKDLRRLTLEHRGSDVCFSTLFDLYGLPNDFPSLDTHKNLLNSVLRTERLEDAVAQEIGDRRVIPYIQCHEFEALVLACLSQLGELLDPSEQAGLKDLKDSIGTTKPEDVNDGELTAPSKRLEANIRSYEKATHGPLAIERAGLDAVRQACPRFSGWLTRLDEFAAG